MEKCKCLLCGHEAERKSATDPTDPTPAGGFAYDCPECGRYLLDDYEHSWVEHQAKENHKKILSDYLKTNPEEEGKFKILRWNDIKELFKLPQHEK